ncbi:DUF6520 family protein [Chitinophaga arvensicola]|uniref:NVEALA protein n=1 Tax=Chitinophaga arvensicola TaxID=29529 RepID=A0A1I0S9K7_9BACT|nr:DUF6520 family protein [Chitinophaga arvensicola]SEW52863.1 hypothetical protein SAMN04488122_5189 [Chitinophaga arvensicola]
MNFKKIGLSVAAFAIAIAGAFATNVKFAETGYTNLQQAPDQGTPCYARGYCAGGFTTCRYTLSSGATVQLLRLESNGTCSSTVLTQP